MARNNENLLIILDYLFHQTDEHHPTRAIDINEYALQTYGVSVDRRSIAETLLELKGLYDAYPDKFPFVLRSVGEIRPKYYVESRGFTKEQILTIASAISGDPYSPAETSDALVDAFLNAVLGEREAKETRELLQKKRSPRAKIAKSVANKLKLIEQAIREKRRVRYEVKGKDKPPYRDYFYRIFYFGLEPSVIIIRDGELTSQYVKNITKMELEQAWYDDPRCKYRLDDEYRGKYSSPEAELRQTLVSSVHAENVCEAIVRFKNDPSDIETVEEWFRFFFKRDLKYKVEGEMCTAKVRSEYKSLLEWLTQYEVANLVQIEGDEGLLYRLKAHYQGLLLKNGLK